MKCCLTSLRHDQENLEDLTKLRDHILASRNLEPWTGESELAVVVGVLMDDGRMMDDGI